MMNDEVRTIMEMNPRTTSPNKNVGELSLEMLKDGITQMLVVDDEVLVGMVTVHDLWKKYENKSSIADLNVSEVMNTNIIRISPKDKIGTAAELFADRRFKSLPVVNRVGKLRGVITAFDIIKVTFKSEYSSPILYQEAFS
ncbi:MAG: CBS domain-containing protein [Saprospiraceae bacterium]|jgi:CBS domain-containing protein